MTTPTTPTTKDLTETPSWPQAVAAKEAWNTIRATGASAEDKQAASDAYKAAMRACIVEAGLAPVRAG